MSLFPASRFSSSAALSFPARGDARYLAFAGLSKPVSEVKKGCPAYQPTRVSRPSQGAVRVPMIERSELMATNGRVIHPTAVVSPKAELGEGVVIGPYCVIEEDTVIGDGCILEAYTVVKRYTRMGCFNHIYPGTVLGGEPQDQKFKGERSYLIIGNRNIIREHVTIHRATGEEQATVIGNDNLIMAYCHIGHNCILGDQISVASYSGISGHAVIESQVVIGGMTGIHQFVTIGKLAMIGGMSKVVQDVPPFMLADGRPAKVVGGKCGWVAARSHSA